MVGLILSESQNKKSGTKFTHQIIERAKIIMNGNIFKDIYPEELAFKLDVNYTTFRKLFKKNTGFAPAKYFQALKISKAKQLLLETSYSVKGIANMLKFYSPKSFNATLKKILV